MAQEPDLARPVIRDFETLVGPRTRLHSGNDADPVEGSDAEDNGREVGGAIIISVMSVTITERN